MDITVSEMDVDDLVDLLLECAEVAENFCSNKVSGQAFLKLTEDDIKELVPFIGVRTEIRGILKELKTVMLKLPCFTFDLQLL